jgi:hypothetical protein
LWSAASRPVHALPDRMSSHAVIAASPWCVNAACGSPALGLSLGAIAVIDRTSRAHAAQLLSWMWSREWRALGETTSSLIVNGLLER